MDRSLKIKLAAGAAGGLAAVGAGGALAATQMTSPKAESQAFVKDAARRLGVKPSELENALKKAFADRIDAAVAGGRLTKAQGRELKQRITAGGLPLAGPPMFEHRGPGPGLDAAASYLGLSVSALGAQLESGKSLAQVAASQGKSADGLVSALLADARHHLDAAVSAGKLTKTQENEMLAGLKTRISSFVHGRAPVFRARPEFGFAGPPRDGAFG